MKYLLLVLLSFEAMAVTPIKKGEVSNQDGYVFSKEEEHKVREKLETSEAKEVKLKELAVVKDEIITNQQKQLEQHEKYADKLQDRLNKETGFWEKTGYFVLGAVITGVIGYGTVRSLK